VVPTSLLDHFVRQCKSSSFESMQAAVEDLVASGFSANTFISQIHDMVSAGAIGGQGR
jgi:hypothetical protein